MIALCGIARPASFEATLQGLGASVREVLAFPDHHRYTEEDVTRLASVARSERVDFVVTTEKDAVRLAGLVPSELPVRAVRMDVKLEGHTGALDSLVRRYAPGWKGEAA